MAITSFTELKTAAANWLRRSDLTDRIPEFIALAEARMNRDSRLRVKASIVRTTLSVSGQFTTLPTGFARMINCELQTSPVVPMEYRSPQQMDVIRAQNATGNPDYYCVHGTELEVAPVPSSAVTLGIIYYSTATALSDSNTTNWLLTAAPDIYLYATLVESAPLLRDDERIAVWEALYNARCEQYMESSRADQESGSPLVVTMGAIGG